MSKFVYAFPTQGDDASTQYQIREDHQKRSLWRLFFVSILFLSFCLSSFHSCSKQRMHHVWEFWSISYTRQSWNSWNDMRFNFSQLFIDSIILFLLWRNSIMHHYRFLKWSYYPGGPSLYFSCYHPRFFIWTRFYRWYRLWASKQKEPHEGTTKSATMLKPPLCWDQNLHGCLNFKNNVGIGIEVGPRSKLGKSSTC